MNTVPKRRAECAQSTRLFFFSPKGVWVNTKLLGVVTWSLGVEAELGIEREKVENIFKVQLSDLLIPGEPAFLVLKVLPQLELNYNKNQAIVW